MNLLSLELSIAKYFGYRQNLIIPNVSWGMGLEYEADIMVISQSRYCTEIELKISKSDLKRDHNKRKWKHDKYCRYGGEIIRRQFFGIPESLKDAIEFIPPQCGILIVSDLGKVHLERVVKLNKSRALTEKEYLHALQLASMRTWTLK